MSRLMRNESITALEAKRTGKKVVFTNGVFDVLHAGHVRLLEQSRALGDILVVGVNTDDSARRLGKGPDRPVNSLEDRITVLSALRSVDFVIPFEDDTPTDLIESVRPDFHVKGGDYKEDDLPEADAVRRHGGKIVILPLLEGRSTTETLRKLRGE